MQTLYSVACSNDIHTCTRYTYVTISVGFCNAYVRIILMMWSHFIFVCVYVVVNSHVLLFAVQVKIL